MAENYAMRLTRDRAGSSDEVWVEDQINATDPEFCINFSQLLQNKIIMMQENEKKSALFLGGHF